MQTNFEIPGSTLTRRPGMTCKSNRGLLNKGKATHLRLAAGVPWRVNGACVMAHVTGATFLYFETAVSVIVCERLDRDGDADQAQMAAPAMRRR
jgi:hypothetical protein